MSKTPLFIQHQAPYAGYNAQETLDALLVMAAFGQNPSVLFQGDAVWQLVGTQDAAVLGRASVLAQLNALSLYDVENVYVDFDSLLQRQLSLDDLAIKAQAISHAHMATFMRQYTFIIRL
jgi:tRNA 2-thiouridine synthesizing protein C